MLNTFELLVNVSNINDGINRTGTSALDELNARKLVVTDYISANSIPETIAKAQVGEIVQGFAYYYM